MVHLTLLVSQQQRVVCSIVHGVEFHNSSLWFAALCVGMCIRLSNLTMHQHQCIHECHLIWKPVKAFVWNCSHDNVRHLADCLLGNGARCRTTIADMMLLVYRSNIKHRRLNNTCATPSLPPSLPPIHSAEMLLPTVITDPTYIKSDDT